MTAITVVCGWITLYRRSGSVWAMAQLDKASLLEHLPSRSTDAGSSESAGPPLANQVVTESKVAGKALPENSELPDGHGKV